ncbi:hypothetical protein, partial [Streptococcus suis]|uniref:hypothetical protein n=1 Tax=Streptococcus suis TaxID=1307 RepID=UPI001C0C6923
MEKHFPWLTSHVCLTAFKKSVYKQVLIAEKSAINLYYGFEPVFLVEKNKKTTSYAGGCQGF